MDISYCCIISNINSITWIFGVQAILKAGIPNDIDLPNFVGQTLDEAKATIGKGKLTLETEEVFDDEVEIGK